ncbi:MULTISPECIES: recombinase family protein [Yersiniaceae]|uniref:recombinase family protein n=1 Tax=Yersiniaceae TaxID=1903411 RepID=UPI000933264A|nr:MULTISPECIES: recombinase family protein [Yersiniaceae]MDV5138935.1 recombinase family protein [Chimaeribacter arupi]
MLIGYIRVSTNDQNTELQRQALISAHCDQIFEDKISGKTLARPGLRRALNRLSAGDTLVVWKLDRLGRSVRHLITLVSELNAKGIHFRSLTDSIDTSTPMGRFFFHIMSALAEMERELIIERTLAGLQAARLEGRIGGRKRKMTGPVLAQAKRLLANGASLQQTALVLDVSVKTLYRYIPAAEQQQLKNSAPLPG